MPTDKSISSLSASERRELLAGLLEKETRGPQAYPLALAQQRLWFFDQLLPGTALYNIPIAVRLEGPLDADSLQKALDGLGRRHQTLRTRFEQTDGTPVQKVDADVTIPLAVVDLQALAPDVRELEALRLATADARRPFDVRMAPLVRARLLRIGEGDHLLVLVMHHLVSDAWSVSVLLRDLEALYDAALAGVPAALSPLKFTYGEFSAQQQASSQDEVMAAEVAYWKHVLADHPPILQFPADRERPVTQSLKGAWVSAELPGELGESIRALCRAEGVTAYVVLLAAYQALLSRYTGEKDILVGSPIAGRTRHGTEDMVGFFVNTLVMRTDLSGDPTFRSLLSRVRRVCIGAFDHQDAPFERVVEAVSPERSLGHTPLFQTMFAFQNTRPPSLHLKSLRPGVMLDPALVHNGGSKVDLALFASEVEGRLSIAFEYCTDLFDAATVTRFLGHYRTLLEGIVAQPDTPIARLPLLTTAERSQLAGWNETATPYPRDRTVTDLFEAQAAETPRAPAVIADGRTLTYEQLNERANQLAHQLRTSGVRPGTRVAVCVERSAELIVALLAVLKAGAAYVPLDADYPRERLSYMLRDSEAAVIVTESRAAERLPAADATTVLVDRYAAGGVSTSNLHVAVQPEQEAYVNYTSGSTGKPKGVAVPHRGIVRLVRDTRYVEFRPSDVFLQMAPVSFDASTFEIWGALLNGARLVIMPRGTPSLRELGDTIRRHSVTTLWLTSALFRHVVDETPEILTPVRQLLTGGDIVPVAQARRVLAALPDCRLINGYGPTESTTFACCHTVTADSVTGTSVPIGKPIANTQAYVLDAQRDLVPIGVPGELYLGGDGLAIGYVGLPRLTSERFVTNPFDATGRGRLYRTGDLVRHRASGDLEFLGRMDRQVKIRGYRIEPEEVESVLAEEPLVREAAVVVDRDTRQSDDPRLVAYVVLAGGAAALPGLRASLGRRLPAYMMPSAFVVLDTLPRTSTGKLDRVALPGRAAAPSHADDVVVAPRTRTEEVLRSLWCEVLGVDDIGMRDGFFDIGGHSLMAVRLVAAIERTFGIRLPLSSLFEGGTIERQAALIDQPEAGLRSSPLVVISAGGTRRPFFLVHGISGEVLSFAELARQSSPEQPFYALWNAPDEGVSSVEETASAYIAAIKTVDASGSYCLGAYSAGGAIALEMAQQLLRQGDKVPALMMLDCGAPGFSKRRPRLTPTIVLSMLRNLVFWPLDDEFLRSGREEATKRLRSKGRQLKARSLSALGIAADQDIRDTLGLYNLPEDSRAYIERYMRALEAYEATPYPGRITLFRSRTTSLWFPYPRDLYWSAVAAGGVDLKVVPGAHDTILRLPWVKHLAAALEDSLRAAQASPQDRPCEGV